MSAAAVSDRTIVTSKGLRVTPLGEGTFEVVDPRGSGEPHHCTSYGDCDCAGRQRGHRRCKHLEAIEEFLLAAPIDVASVAPIGPGLEPDVPPPPPAEDDFERPPLELVRPGPTAAGEAARAPLVRSLKQLLEDPDALKPPEATIPRLAWRGRVSLLIGREKLSGKSTCATAGCAAVTRGAEFIGEPCTTGSVLWVTADQEHASEIAQRAVRFGADPELFHVLWPHQPFADLMAVVDHLDPFPAVVVIDTLASFARTIVTDPHSSAEWPAVLVPLLRLARDCNLAVLVVHHANKREGGGYRDSSAIGALVDMLLELEPDTANPARRTVKALGRWPVQNFAVELGGDRYGLVAGGELSLDAKVLAYIQQHPKCSQAAVRGAIGGRAENVNATVARLLGSGAVRDISSGNRHAYVVVDALTTAPADDEGESRDLPF